MNILFCLWCNQVRDTWVAKLQMAAQNDSKKIFNPLNAWLSSRHSLKIGDLGSFMCAGLCETPFF